MKVFNKVFAILMAFSVIMLTSTPVLAAESIANATVTGVQYEVEETGSAITFPITVKLGDTQLTEDTDYTVTYSNNTVVGQASLKITGIGAYEGEQLIAFTIVAKEETSDTAEDTVEEVEEEEEEDEDDAEKETTSKKDDTSDKAKVSASDKTSKTGNGTVKKSNTTGSDNTSNSGSKVTTNNNSTSNSSTKDAAANNTTSTVKKSAKSPKTGDYDNGLLISFAALSILLLAGGAYYIHLKRA